MSIKILLVTLFGASSLAFSAIEITVPPGGSLAAARDAIRAKRQAGEKGPALILLKSGTYEVTEPLLLEAQDSSLTIRAAQGASPLLIGGTVVKGFTTHQGKILKADLSAWVGPGVKYRQLLLGGRRMILARYPNYTPANPLYGGWAFTQPVPATGAPAGHDPSRACYINPKDARKWAHPEDVELDIYTGHNYWNSIVPLKSLDPATRLLGLATPGSFEIFPHSRFHFQNAIEELDAPGEWFLDPREKILYFWPPAALAKSETRLVTLETFVRIASGAKNIRIERLGFTGCNGTAITITDAEDCLVAGCTLSTVGGYRGRDFGAGILINGGKRNSATGNDISDVGGDGITLKGGDRITLTPSHNQAVNNHIHHIGVYNKGGIGVNCNGVGLTVAHNLIHDCPRMGVQMFGNNIIVEYNHLHHLCLETNDTSAIYTGGRDWLGGRGNVWRYNRIHDIIGCAQEEGGLKHPAFTFGLYPDDNSGGLDIIGNLVYGIPDGALLLHNARDCVVENNIFAFCGKSQTALSGWVSNSSYWTGHVATMIAGYESVVGQPAWKKMRGMDLHPNDAIRDDGTIMSGNRIRRNIMLSNSPTALHIDARNATPKWNTIDGNLVWNSGRPINTGIKITGPDKGPPLLSENFDATAPGKVPGGWYRIGKPNPDVKLAVADGILQIDCAAEGSGFRGPEIPAKPGTSYRVRMKVKSTEAASKVTVFIAIYKDKQGYWQGKNREITATREWQEIEATANLPAGDDPAWKPWMTGCYINVRCEEEKGRISIDDISLTEAVAPDEWAAWKAAGWDRNSLVADPLFENAAKNDYRLKPESPAITRLGFKPLPIEKMGLINDRWRKR